MSSQKILQNSIKIQTLKLNQKGYMSVDQDQYPMLRDLVPFKMHSKCESVDVFQPTELWEKYGKHNYGKMHDRQELTCQV